MVKVFDPLISFFEEKEITPLRLGGRNLSADNEVVQERERDWGRLLVPFKARQRKGEGLLSGAAGAEGVWGERGLVMGLCFIFCCLTESPSRAESCSYRHVL